MEKGKVYKGMEKIDLSKYANLKGKDKSIVKHRWQDSALKALESLATPDKKRSSVFRCFKENENMANKALVDCKELGRLDVMYFLKLWDIYTGKKINKNL
jgi:hypothetical protein